MDQPQGFIINTDYPNYVCRLNKAIYGLKQAVPGHVHRRTLHQMTLSKITTTDKNYPCTYTYVRLIVYQHNINILCIDQIITFFVSLTRVIQYYTILVSLTKPQ
jgi:hypothetical protein